MTRSSSLPHRTVVQAKALLLAADGKSIYETARRVDVASNSVRAWRRRFEVEGLGGVGRIAEGRGATPSVVTPEVEAAVVSETRLERGVFISVDSLTDAIETWVEHWNDDPHPFVWTKTAEAILAKAGRARTTLTASVNPATHH